jgi:hypothetical protein
MVKALSLSPSTTKKKKEEEEEEEVALKPQGKREWVWGSGLIRVSQHGVGGFPATAPTCTSPSFCSGREKSKN